MILLLKHAVGLDPDLMAGVGCFLGDLGAELVHFAGELFLLGLDEPRVLISEVILLVLI